MYRRLCEDNGLGNPEPCKLDNNITIDTKAWGAFCDDFCDKYKLICEWEGYDFHCDPNAFYVGIEPTYMYDKLLIVKFDLDDKNKSSITTGVAFGAYGTNCVSKTSVYGDYKRASKFTRFIDQWYDFVKTTISANGSLE